MSDDVRTSGNESDTCGATTGVKSWRGYNTITCGKPEGHDGPHFNGVMRWS